MLAINILTVLIFMLLTDIPIILTNLIIFVSVGYAIKTNRLLQGYLLSLAGIISLIYHFLWCLNLNETMSSIRYYYTFMDYHHECLVGIVIATTCLNLDDKRIETVITIILTCIYICLNVLISNFESLDGNSSLIEFISFGNKIFVISVMSIVCLITIVTSYCISNKLPKLNIFYLMMSLISTISAIIFFWLGSSGHYWIYHSLWHTLIMLTPLLIFKMIDDETNILTSISTSISTLTSKLKEYYRKKNNVENNDNHIMIDIAETKEIPSLNFDWPTAVSQPRILHNRAKTNFV